MKYLELIKKFKLMADMMNMADILDIEDYIDERSDAESFILLLDELEEICCHERPK